MNPLYILLPLCLIAFAGLVWAIRRTDRMQYAPLTLVAPLNFVRISALASAALLTAAASLVVSMSTNLALAIVFACMGLVFYVTSFALARYQFKLLDDGVLYIPYFGKTKFASYESINYLEPVDSEYVNVVVDYLKFAQIGSRSYGYKEVVKALHKKGVRSI